MLEIKNSKVFIFLFLVFCFSLYADKLEFTQKEKDEDTVIWSLSGATDLPLGTQFIYQLKFENQVLPNTVSCRILKRHNLKLEYALQIKKIPAGEYSFEILPRFEEVKGLPYKHVFYHGTKAQNYKQQCQERKNAEDLLTKSQEQITTCQQYYQSFITSKTSKTKQQKQDNIEQVCIAWLKSLQTIQQQWNETTYFICYYPKLQNNIRQYSSLVTQYVKALSNILILQEQDKNKKKKNVELTDTQNNLKNIENNLKIAEKQVIQEIPSPNRLTIKDLDKDIQWMNQFYRKIIKTYQDNITPKKVNEVNDFQAIKEELLEECDALYARALEYNDSPLKKKYENIQLFQTIAEDLKKLSIEYIILLFKKHKIQCSFKTKENPDLILHRLRNNVLLLIAIPQQENLIKQQQLQEQQEAKKKILTQVIELDAELKKGLASIKKQHFPSYLVKWKEKINSILESNNAVNSLDKNLKNKITTFCSIYLKRLDLQDKILKDNSLKKEIITQIQIRQWERELRTIISQLAQAK